MPNGKEENALSSMPRVRVSNGNGKVSIGKEGNAHTISERPVNMRTTVRIMARAKTDPMTASGDDRNDRNTVQMITGK